MGALTRHRTFLIIPNEVDLKIPSGLFGMTPLKYEIGALDTLAARITPVANQLREIIKKKGAK